MYARFSIPVTFCYLLIAAGIYILSLDLMYKDDNINVNKTFSAIYFMLLTPFSVNTLVALINFKPGSY